MHERSHYSGSKLLGLYSSPDLPGSEQSLNAIGLKGPVVGKVHGSLLQRIPFCWICVA